MTTFEETYKKIFADHGALVKLLIGGLLCFVPIVNLVALGYIRVYARQIRETGDFVLPSWKRNPLPLALEGVYLAACALVYAALPALVCAALASALVWLTGGVLGNLAWIIVAPAVALALPLTAAANYRFVCADEWRAMLDFKTVFGTVAATWRSLAVPSLACLGLTALFWQVYGLSFFFAALGFFAYATLRFVHLDKQGLSSAE